MKPRKIVQVAFQGGEGVDVDFLHALTDTGEVWWFEEGKKQWTKIPPIPPIEEPEGEEGK